MEYRVGEFEGPLDLLLYLISKHRMKIEDVEITSLLDQYMAYIDAMKDEDLEIASSFLEMAARLVYLKTLSLLPRHKEAEEIVVEIKGQLSEYRLCKEMAEKLRKKQEGVWPFVRSPEPVPVDPLYRRIHPKEVLLEAYLMAAGKAKRRLPPPVSAFSGIVSRKMVSVPSKILFILRKLYRTGEASYEDFFSAGDKSEKVATFLAMLELIKSSRIRLSDDNQFVYFQRREKRRKKE